MAYTADDFLRDMALVSLGGIATLERARLASFVGYAAKKGIQLGAFTAVRGAGVAAANPYATGAVIGTGLGQAALQTEPGQQLLAASEESGRQTRLRMERAIQDSIYGTQEKIKRATKRKVNKFSKAVGAGVKAVKLSKFQGAKGKLTSPKRTFSTVTKVASRLKKGKKVGVKGVTGTIKRAIGRFL